MQKVFCLTRVQALALFAYFTKIYTKELTVKDMQEANEFLMSEDIQYSVLDNFGDFVLRNKIEIIDCENCNNCKCKNNKG